MVSVIVPIYNVEAYLPRCIESICTQTLADLEIILVDDGSTDRSGAICDEYARKDSRIVVIHKENGGLVSARQAGLKIATGDYVGYVDSDDWIEPTMYEDMAVIGERNHADIVNSPLILGGDQVLNEALQYLPAGVYKTEDHTMDRLIRNLLYVEDYSEEGIAPSVCCKLFKRKLLCRYQFNVDPRITYNEDAACSYPCLINAKVVVIMEHAYYHACFRKDSISHSSDELFFERITFLYQLLEREFSNHPASEILRKQLNRHVFKFVVDGINKLFGFGYGVVVPHFLPPLDLFQKKNLNRIVLYGAGTVGQCYYRLFQLTRLVEVVGWVDRQWEQYKETGFPVQPVTAIGRLEYDGILISVKKNGLAEAIKENLLKLGVSECKIWYEPPQRLLYTLDKGWPLW